MKPTELNLSKAVLICCNVVFFLCGLALVGLGATLLLDAPRVLLSRLFAVFPTQPLFYYVSLSLIALGLLIAAVAVLGCWAAYLHHRCLLALFLFFLIVLLLGEGVVVVLAIMCPQYLGIGVGTPVLVDLLQRNYGIAGKEQLTAAFDLAQTAFECCGITGAADYDFSWWRLKELGQRELLVPRSCCTLSNNDINAFLDPHPINMTMCQSVGQAGYKNARHAEGCSVKLENWFRDHATLFLALGLGLVLVELSVLLSAILACVRVPSRHDYISQASHYGGSTTKA